MLIFMLFCLKFNNQTLNLSNMKKQVITVAMLMLSMGYTFAGNFDTKGDSALAVPKMKILSSDKASVYNLFYVSENRGIVDVKIYDSSGRKIHDSYYKTEDALNLKQSYDLSGLPFGIYKFEVVNKGVKTTEMVHHKEIMIKMDVRVAQTVEKGKYRLDVSRDIHKPVFVKIYDDQEKIIYQDVIDVDADFRRVYDLSTVTAKAVSFEVSCGGTKSLHRLN